MDRKYFPSELKKGKVVRLPKSTDKTNPTNYRRISLLFVLAKLLKTYVQIHLSDYLEKRQHLLPFQCEFRRKYSCNTALARLTNCWLSALNKGEVSGAAFLDLKKAFVLVDHDVLLRVLIVCIEKSSALHFKIIS